MDQARVQHRPLINLAADAALQEPQSTIVRCGKYLLSP